MSKSNNDAEERVREAVRRIELALEDLTAVARDRTTDSLERAAERLQEAAERARQSVGAGTERSRRRYASRYREPLREPAWLWSDKPRTRTLYRDVENGKILGVCAGIANYYGMESWVVRCLAVTGLIFLNWMVLTAYLVAALILAKEPPRTSSAESDQWQRRRASALNAPRKRTARSAVRPPPRRQMRDIGADLNEVELRLRRIEAHVTSGRYELQRELAKIGET